MDHNTNEHRLKCVVQFYVDEFLADTEAFKPFACAEVVKDPETKERLLAEVAAATWFCEKTPAGGPSLQFNLAMHGACDPTFDVIPSAILEFAKNEEFVATVAELHNAKPVSTRELKRKLRRFVKTNGRALVDRVLEEFGEDTEVGEYEDEVVEFVLAHYAESTFELPKLGLSDRSVASAIRMQLLFGEESFGKMVDIDLD